MNHMIQLGFSSFPTPSQFPSLISSFDSSSELCIRSGLKAFSAVNKAVKPVIDSNLIRRCRQEMPWIGGPPSLPVPVAAFP